MSRIVKCSVLIVICLIMAGMGIAGCGQTDKAAAGGEGEYTSIDELDGKKVAVQMGSIFDKVLTENAKNVDVEYYNSFPDEIAALDAKKVEGVPTTRMIFSQMQIEYESKYALIDEEIGSIPLAYLFPKNKEGKELRGKMNELLAELSGSGELEKLQKKWRDPDESVRTIEDYESLPAKNGTLTFLTEGTFPPFNYVRDEQVVGYDVDIAALFCKKYGYRLDVKVMSFDALMPAVKSGKCDFAASGIAITKERAESVYFSEPNIYDEIVIMVRTASGKEGGFIASLKNSFEKTFVREARYKLFIKGIGMTIAITVLAILFGTLLGFLAYMWFRSGGRAADAVTRFCVWLVQGLPAVVLLMILYYIVFGKSSLGGMWVAVIGFTLIFGAAVYGMLKTGVSAVGKGQEEAAYALGFTDRQSFFGVVLPQAAQYFMPSYKAEIVSLIKATAIVGYIAVEDLTKMGDIIRSRTYEPFFPLIAVAVIYFILAGILTVIVDRATIPVDPKRRTKEQILKGVKTDD